MWEKLLAFLKSIGIDITGKEDQLKTEFEKLKKDDDGKIDFSKIDLSKLQNDNPFFKALLDQNNALMVTVKDLQATITKEQTDRENAIKTASENAKTERTKKIDAAVQKLYDDKKITEAQKAQWKIDYETNFEMAERMAALLPVAKQFQGKDNKGVTQTTSATNEGGKETKQSPLRTLTEAIRDQMGTGDKQV